MEAKKEIYNEKGNKKNKKIIILPKSYIGQEPKTLRAKRSASIIENNLNLNEIEGQIDNPFRSNTERKIKKVTFNNNIQIINIVNYKNENRILYFGNNVEDQNEIVKKENKCLSCIIS